MNTLQQKIILAIVVLSLCILAFFVVQQQFHNPIIQNHAPQQNDHTHDETQSTSIEESIASHMKELQENPNSLHAILAIAQGFFQLQQWQQAISFLEKALIQQPNDPPTLYMLAFCQTQQKNYSAAEKNFVKFTTLSTDPIGYMSLGVLYQSFLKDNKKAKIAFQKVVDSPNADPRMKEDAKNILKTLQ